MQGAKGDEEEQQERAKHECGVWLSHRTVNEPEFTTLANT